MGKNKRKKQKRCTGPAAPVKGGTESVEKLIELAETSINNLTWEPAKEYCERALAISPNNLKVLDMLSGLLLEMGDGSAARDLLLKMVELEPDTGHKKYLSLAQLHEGRESLNYYSKATQILESLLQKCIAAKSDASAQDAEESVLKRELSLAYCAQAEIFMTDCCFEEDAEAQCIIFIDKSISSDSNNPESYQCKVNYLLVKENFEEAKSTMQHSLSLWLPKYQAIRNNEEEKVEKFDPIEVCSLSYQSRISTCKLLIELEMLEEANDILDGLTEEDDEVVDSWYLLGWLNYLRGKDFYGNARYYLRKAKEVAQKVDFDDEGELQHIHELLEELGPGDSDNEEEDKENCDAESDINSEEEMEQ